MLHARGCGICGLSKVDRLDSSRWLGGRRVHRPDDASVGEKSNRRGWFVALASSNMFRARHRAWRHHPTPEAARPGAGRWSVAVEPFGATSAPHGRGTDRLFGPLTHGRGHGPPRALQSVAQRCRALRRLRVRKRLRRRTEADHQPLTGPDAVSRCRQAIQAVWRAAAFAPQPRPVSRRRGGGRPRPPWAARRASHPRPRSTGRHQVRRR